MSESLGSIQAISPDPSSFLQSRSGIESSGNYLAINPNTGALGKYQILPSTYSSLRKYDSSLPEDTSLFLKDTNAQERAGSLLEGLYTDEIKRSGHEVTHANKDIWHFFGADEGNKILKADKNAPIESIVRPEVLKNNPQLKGKTVAEVISLNSTEKNAKPIDTKLPNNVEVLGKVDEPSETSIPEGVEVLGKVNTLKESDTSAAKVFEKGLLGSAAQAVGVAPFMATGAEIGGALGTTFGPWGTIAGTVIGGIGGAIGGDKFITAVTDTLPEGLKEAIGYDKATREAERRAHPEAAFTADLGGNLVLFRPGSLATMVLKDGTKIGSTAQRVGMSVLGGGIEAGQELLNEGKIDPLHVAEAAAFNAYAAKPTKYMEKLGGIWRARDPVDAVNFREWGADGTWQVPTNTADGLPITVGPTNMTRPDGSYLPAGLVKDANGRVTSVAIDVDHIKNEFNQRPWTNPSNPDVHPLAADEFKSPEEYAQFMLKLQEARANNPRGPMDDTAADYANRMNQHALESLRANPYYNLTDSSVPPVPHSDEDLKNFSYSIGKNKEADFSLAIKQVREAMETDGLTTQMMNRISRHFEGDTSITLTPREVQLINKHYKPAMEAAKQYYKYAIKEGLMEPFNFDKEFFGRILVPKQISKWQRFKNLISGGNFGGFDPHVDTLPGSALDRTIFAGQMRSGNRVILQGPDKNGVIWEWKDGRQRRFTQLRPGEKFKAGEKIGNVEIKEAKNAEIEQHTPYTYEKNSLLVQMTKLAEMRDLYRTNEYMKNFKQSQYFTDSAIKADAGTVIPKDWSIPKNQQDVLKKFPQLAGYAFPKRTTEIIEDMTKRYDPNTLNLLSGVLIKNMMLNPLPHMFNEAWHLYNARGLTGWVTPAGVYRFAKTGLPSLKSVMKQDAFFLKVLREGGSLLSADVRNSAFATDLFAKANKEFMATPEAESLAKSLGMSLPRLYEAISKKAGIAMWVVRDMMYMQQIKEHMKYGNMSIKQAIQETERHMPSYRINERVGEKVLGADMSRRLSEVLQNPNVTVFSRYHYGMVKSLIETAKDMGAIRKGRAGVQEFKNGVDTAAAIAVAIAVLYPLQDMIAQAMTGNPDAKQRRAGPFHIFHALHGVYSGEKDPMAVLSSIFTFNPALLSGAQLIADRKLYNGQPVYNPEDSALKISYDVAKYLSSQVPYVGQAEKAASYEEGGGLELLARQADIESPPEEVTRKRENIQRKRVKAGTIRSERFESDMQDAFEGLLD